MLECYDFHCLKHLCVHIHGALERESLQHIQEWEKVRDQINLGLFTHCLFGYNTTMDKLH